MEKWNHFKGVVNTLLDNLNMIEQFMLGEVTEERVFPRIIERAKHFYEQSCGRDGVEIGVTIRAAQHELSAYLINESMREGICQRADYDFRDMMDQLSAVEKKWEMNHVRHKAFFHREFYPLVQPIYDFYDWYVEEKKAINKTIKAAKTETSEKPNELTKIRIRNAVSLLTPETIDDVYYRNFSRFMYINSDEVIVNGKRMDDKLLRQKMMFKGFDGKPNIKTVTVDQMKDGFPLTELDFIDYELGYIRLYGHEDFKLRKQIETYLIHLEEQRSAITNGKDQPKPQQFPNEIFVSAGAFELFNYLLEHFAFNKSVVQLSQIFHWMKEEKHIRSNTGVKYKALILSMNLTDLKFSRIADFDRENRPILNDLAKTFFAADQKFE